MNELSPSGGAWNRSKYAVSVPGIPTFMFRCKLMFRDSVDISFPLICVISKYIFLEICYLYNI